MELRIVGVEKDELLSGIESLLEKLESLVGVAEPELEVAEFVERDGEVALELRIVGVEKDELLSGTARACWKNSRALSVLPSLSWRSPSLLIRDGEVALELRIVGVEKDELLSNRESLLEKLESLVGVAEPELEVAEFAHKRRSPRGDSRWNRVRVRSGIESG